VSRLGRADIRWIAGGALGAAVLLAITWFLLVLPERAEQHDFAVEASAAQGRVPALQQRLTELRKQYEHLPEYREKLRQKRQALPATPSLSDLLRELQVAGDASGVSVSGLNVGGAIAQRVAGAQVYAFPLSLTAKGGVERLNAFLDQLQQVQPRALLIDSAVLTAPAPNNAGPVTATLALTLKAFVSPSSATAVSSPSPSASN
jgi:Tfp pilus assembly protein PilO